MIHRQAHGKQRFSTYLCDYDLLLLLLIGKGHLCLGMATIAVGSALAACGPRECCIDDFEAVEAVLWQHGRCAR